MNQPITWDEWLVVEDSASVLAPRGYDDSAGRERARMLWKQLTSALDDCEVRPPTPDWYQDSTALADIRIATKADTRTFAPALAWILLSHFGRLATVKDCQDAELLSRIQRALQDSGLRYIPYDYAASKTYLGQCRGLSGFSWANRYFALAVEFNDQFDPEDYNW